VNTMHCLLLQDWLTLRIGNVSTITAINQDETDWLEMGAYQDLVAWLDVREVTTPGTPLYIDFQTAPVKDEAYFASLVNNAGGVTVSTANTPTVVRMTKSSAYTPLSKWLRWRLNTNTIGPSAIGDVTFRIWVAANYTSMRPRVSSGAPLLNPRTVAVAAESCPSCAQKSY
jgi:hypothetical protein